MRTYRLIACWIAAAMCASAVGVGVHGRVRAADETCCGPGTSDVIQSLVGGIRNNPLDPPPPIVTLKVRVPACAVAGQDIEYRLCVENCSPSPAHHVLVRNPLPSNAKLVRARPEAKQKEGELQWYLGTLCGGGRREIVLVLRASDDADVQNCARVQFEHGQCVTTRLSRSPAEGREGTPGVPLDTVPAPPDGKPTPADVRPIPPDLKPVPADAKLTMTINGPREQYLNYSARYDITVSNAGPGPATNVLVNSELPDKTRFVEASAGGKFLANQAAWLLGTLPAGASKTVSLTLRSELVGEKCVRAGVLADGGATDQAEYCTLFKGASALQLEMVDRQDPIEVGGETSYPILLRNQGQTPITNIRVTVVLPEGMELLTVKGPSHKLINAQTLLFEPATLSAGAQTAYEVHTRGLRPGDVRLRVALTADQLEGGVVEEQELTTIIPSESPPPPQRTEPPRL